MQGLPFDLLICGHKLTKMANYTGRGLHLKDGLIHIYLNCLVDLSDKDFSEEFQHVKGYACQRLLITGPVKRFPIERLRLIVHELDRFSGHIALQKMKMNDMEETMAIFDRINTLSIIDGLYGRPSWQRLLSMIQEKRVRELNLSWRRDGKKMESYFQLTSPWLEEISMIGSAYDLNQLGGWIKRLPNLKTLQLMGMKIFADSVDPFFDVLCHHPSIETVEYNVSIYRITLMPDGGLLHSPISGLVGLDDAVRKWVDVRRRVVLLASSDLLPEDIFRHVYGFIKI
jgi:hypothetical protein